MYELLLGEPGRQEAGRVEDGQEAGRVEDGQEAGRGEDGHEAEPLEEEREELPAPEDPQNPEAPPALERPQNPEASSALEGPQNPADPPAPEDPQSPEDVEYELQVREEAEERNLAPGGGLVREQGTGRDVAKPSRGEVIDKSNMTCQGCRITFGGRQLFLQHCHLAHGWRLR